MPVEAPDIQTIEQVSQANATEIRRTPLVDYYGSYLQQEMPDTPVSLKLELFQVTGSFKPRGALQVMRQIPAAAQAAGVTAFSAGNHAIATAYAAASLGLSAKVAMPETASPLRVKRCRDYGAEVVFGDSIEAVLEIVAHLQQHEGRTLVHPFEGEHTVAGTGTLGLEMHQQAGPLDVVIVPVGGGGLIAGVAAAISQLQPQCRVFGVEPEGAAGVRDSLLAGEPLPSVKVKTIADSLGAPLHMPYTFGVIQQCVEQVVTVSDADLVASMRLMQEDLKLAVEPAAAAALAAMLGPLRDVCQHQRVGLVVCGSNIDIDTHQRLVNQAPG